MLDIFFDPDSPNAKWGYILLIVAILCITAYQIAALIAR